MSSTLLRVAELMGGSTESHEEALEAGRQVIAVLKSRMSMRLHLKCVVVLIFLLSNYDILMLFLLLCIRVT